MVERLHRYQEQWEQEVAASHIKADQYRKLDQRKACVQFSFLLGYSYKVDLMSHRLSKIASGDISYSNHVTIIHLKYHFSVTSF